MNNLKITPGEWYVEEHGDWCNVMSQHPDLTFGDIVCQDSEKVDARAIVTAVNNTYKIEINPKSVKFMKAALMGVLYAIENSKLDNGGVALGDRLEARIRRAIKKAEELK